MSRKTFAERADAAVGWTGIPALMMDPPRRRPQRWWPLFALVLALAGFAWMLLATTERQAGMLALVIAVAVACFARAQGPLLLPSASERLDERDRDVLHRSQAWAGVLLGIVAPFATMGLGTAALAGGWDVHRMIAAITAFAFVQIVAWATLPTLFASWSARPLDADDADDQAD